MSFEDSEKAARVTLQQHYNFVMNQAVSITYDLWHIIFMKILLIEDNQRTQEWVTQGLSEAGYVIDAVSDGRDGLYLALKDDYALIILDIMLPGMDGWQILQTLRTAKQTPVICLTARDSVDDRVRGLDSGANDYLVKPFSFSELLAKGSGTIKATSRFEFNIRNQWLKNGLCKSKCEQGQYQYYTDAQGVSVTLATGLQSWRNYTQNGYCE